MNVTRLHLEPAVEPVPVECPDTAEHQLWADAGPCAGAAHLRGVWGSLVECSRCPGMFRIVPEEVSP